MQRVSVQELRVRVDRRIHAGAAHHALPGSLQLAVGQQHRGKGRGVQDAPVRLHLRLLELQQAVSVDE